MKNTGTIILNMINSMNVNSNTQVPVNEPKRKMRGPDISFDDLDDLSDDE